MITAVWRRVRRGRHVMRLSRRTPPTHAGGSDTTGGVDPYLSRRDGPTLPVVLVIGFMLTLGVLAGCGSSDEGEADSGENAEPSEASGPSVSPPPEDAPELDQGQKEAYEAAVRKYAEYEDFVDEVGRDLKDTKENARRLVSLTVPPVTKDYTDSLDELIDNDIHIEGSRKVEWSSPVKVTDSKVVFKQCQSPGNWVAIQGDQKETEEANTVSKVTVVKLDDGHWYVKKNKATEDC